MPCPKCFKPYQYEGYNSTTPQYCECKEQPKEECGICGHYPPCLHSRLDKILDNVLGDNKEKWEDRFDERFYDGLEKGKTTSGLPAKFVIKRVRENLSLDEIKDFIRETIKTEREQAVKEERERILKLLPKEISNINNRLYSKRTNIAYANGYNILLEEVKKILTN